MKLRLSEMLASLILKLIGLSALRRREAAAQLEYIGEVTGKIAPRLRDNAPLHELHGYTFEAERTARQFASATADVLGDEELTGFQALLAQVVNLKLLRDRSPGERKEVLLAELAEVAAAFRAGAATLKSKG